MLLVRSFHGALFSATLPLLSLLYSPNWSSLCASLAESSGTMLLNSLAEVLSHAPHGKPLHFIAGGVIGQDVALKEQPPGHAHKASIRLANAEPCGGQHSSQLHHLSLYVAQVPIPVWGVGCCRRHQADQLIPGLPCGQGLSQIIKVGYDICKGAFIPLHGTVCGGLLQQHATSALTTSVPVASRKASTSMDI